MKELTNHRVSPVTWVPTVYFAMGMPFVVLNMVTALMFKGLGITDTQIAFPGLSNLCGVHFLKCSRQKNISSY